MEIIGLMLLVMGVIGLALLLAGFVGSIEVSEPKCAKCGYDVRASLTAIDSERRCPECGAHLNDKRSVSFGRRSRRPRMMLTGAIMAALPIAVFGATAIAALNGIEWEDLRSDESVISDLATDASTPWTWRRLEKRFNDGKLDQNEIAQAIEQLIAHLTASGSNGGPLHWADTFVTSVDSQISDEQYLRLCHAFYGAAPQVKSRTSVRFRQPLKFEVKYGDHWNLPGVKLVKALREVRLAGGRTLTIVDDADKSIPDSFSRDAVWDIEGTLKDELLPGEHNLEFVVDIGIVPETARFTAYNGRPGQMARWNSPRITWTATIPVYVSVLDHDDELIELTTDSELNPAKRFNPTLLTQLSNNGIQLQLDYGVGKGLPVPVSCDVVVELTGRKPIMLSFASDGNRSSWSAEVELKTLAPEIRAAHILFKPNPRHIEHFYGVTQIWGGEFRFDDVPIQRFDLQTQ